MTEETPMSVAVTPGDGMTAILEFSDGDDIAIDLAGGLYTAKTVGDEDADVNVAAFETVRLISPTDWQFTIVWNESDPVGGATATIMGDYYSWTAFTTDAITGQRYDAATRIYRRTTSD